MKKKAKIIVACGKNGEIGLENKLLWSISEDLAHFKNLTSGGFIIMGRKTFESIGKILPKRISIVLSKDGMFREKYHNNENCFVVSSLADALKICETKTNEFVNNSSNIFIIGGGQIYKQALQDDIVNEIYLTKVHSDFKADTFFHLEEKKWKKEILKTITTKDFTIDFLRYFK